MDVILASDIKESLSPNFKKKDLFNKLVITERDTCLVSKDRLFLVSLKKSIFGYDENDISFIIKAGYKVTDVGEIWRVTLP